MFAQPHLFVPSEEQLQSALNDLEQIGEYTKKCHFVHDLQLLCQASNADWCPPVLSVSVCLCLCLYLSLSLAGCLALARAHFLTLIGLFLFMSSLIIAFLTY